MLNNDVRLIGRAITNYERFEKVTKFKIEMTKQKKGDTYELEVLAYNNSRGIRFDEELKGRLVAVAGYIDDNKNIYATNVLCLTAATTSPQTVADVEVVTARDFEANNNVEISDDDLPF